MHRRINTPFILLIFLASISMMTGVMYTASLPQICLFFKTTPAFSEMTLYLYVFGFALGYLFYPFLAGRFGRKKALCMGLLISLLGSATALSSSISYFKSTIALGRIIQAVGASQAVNYCMTEISGRYSQKERAKIFPLFMTFLSIPIFSMVLGGYITKYYGWVGCFVFLFVYTLVLLILAALYAGSDLGKDSQPFSFKVAFIGIIRQIKSPKTILCGILIGLSISSSFVFSGTAPYIGIEMLGYSPDRFGLYFLFPAVFIIIGGLVASRLSSLFSNRKMILVGGGLMLAFSTLMLIAFLAGHTHLLTLFLLYSLILICVIFVASASVSIALSQSKHLMYQSAVFNFFALLYSTAPVIALSLIHDSFVFQLPIILTLQSVAILALLCVISRVKGTDL